MVKLTEVYDKDTTRQMAMTRHGMAHWAGTGPAGKLCGDCRFFGIMRNDGKPADKKCAKFKALMGKAGPVIPKFTSSCRHFE